MDCFLGKKLDFLLLRKMWFFFILVLWEFVLKVLEINLILCGFVWLLGIRDRLEIEDSFCFCGFLMKFIY